MTEITIKLTQLYDTADAFARASLRFEQSAQLMHDIAGELLALNVPEHALLLTPQAEVGRGWSEACLHFADSLNETANAVLEASGARLPHFDLSLLPAAEDVPAAAAVPPAAIEPASAAAHPILAPLYISAANRPLFDELTMKRGLLQQQQESLLTLQLTRQQTVANLSAVRNRLVSLDPEINPDASPQMQLIQTRLETLDGEIGSTALAVRSLDASVTQLEGRLAAVVPQGDIDVAALNALEGADSPDWLVDNTYDCVQHVVERMPVPGNLARDAKHWVTQAQAMPDYGIGVGDAPLTGSVLVMQPEHAYADDVYGHVLYVERVEDSGIVWVTDNHHPDVPVRLSDITSELSGENMTYLYFPWQTKA